MGTVGLGWVLGLGTWDLRVWCGIGRGGGQISYGILFHLD